MRSAGRAAWWWTLARRRRSTRFRRKGEYLGGVIAPGIGISAEALFERTARLPRVDIKRPPHVIGSNTVHSLQSGLFYGYVGLVDGILERLLGELGPARVIATGGMAPLIASGSRFLSRD